MKVGSLCVHVCVCGGCYQLPPSNPQRSGPLPVFSLHAKSREGRWGDGVVMLRTEGVHVQIYHLCQTRGRIAVDQGSRRRRNRFARRGGVEGRGRQRIDKQ